MNSVIAYKQFGLGEGLAELFSSEIKDLKSFKASIIASAKHFCDMFGYSECYKDNWSDNTTWKEKTGHSKDCRI